MAPAEAWPVNSYSYRAYGLGIESNLQIPGLVGTPRSGQADLRVRLGEMPDGLDAWQRQGQQPFYLSEDRNELGQPELEVFRDEHRQRYILECADGTRVVVSLAGDAVWATWPPESSLEDTATYLLGPILGLVLRLRGLTCLHSSAIALGDGAVALVGPSGAGKSTTAAAFAQLGYPVVADDVLALEETAAGVRVHPAYPRVRLHAESVRGLFGPGAELPRLTPNWDKCFLDLALPGFQFQEAALPLMAIFLLGERRPGDALPRLEAVPSRIALMDLIGETFANRLLSPAQRAHEFALLGRLVQTVPVMRAWAPADMSRLPEFCRMIADAARPAVASA